MNKDVSDIITLMKELNDTVYSLEENKNDIKESLDDLKKDFDAKMDSFEKEFASLKKENIPVDNSQENNYKT